MIVEIGARAMPAKKPAIPTTANASGSVNTYGHRYCKVRPTAAPVHPPITTDGPNTPPEPPEPPKPKPPLDAVPRIRFVHVQGDDIVLSLTGCPSYVVELKTRRSGAGFVVGRNHPYCFSMTPFHARLQVRE